MVTKSADWPDIYDFVQRARAADETGKVFRLAVLGFFRQSVLLDPTNSEAHFRYALAVSFVKRPNYDLAETHLVRATILKARTSKLYTEAFEFVMQDLGERETRPGEAMIKYQQKEAAKHDLHWQRVQHLWNFMFMIRTMKVWIRDRKVYLEAKVRFFAMRLS